jgi:predicted DNA-binding transcriptional regulator YafY
MDRTERFYRIDRLLRNHRVVTMERFLEELGVSRATFKRDLEYMRDRLNAPIGWDREKRGYRFRQEEQGAPGYELPGLWFNDSEILALLTMERLLEEIEPGILGARLEPIKQRLCGLLESADHSAEEVRSRIRILRAASRARRIRHFETVAFGLMKRRRLHIEYFVRSRGELTRRDVSPQRLVHYRDNWYLDAWCHAADGLRSFALDAVERAIVLEERARDIPARWVANEEWHPQQRTGFDAQGRYLLEVPYSQEPELLMDILKFGPDIEVLDPPDLRQRVAELLVAAADRYR